jgi:hypothetical protein
MPFRKCLFLSVLSLAGALALAGSIAAQSASGVSGPARGGGNGRAKVILELKAARHLLHTALHDYDGHRVAAVRQVTEALHDLQPQPNPAQAGKTTPSAGAGSPKAPTGVSKPNAGQAAGQAGAAQETQQESDKKLNEAKNILEKLQPHLTQHPKAAEHVAQALKDINAALSIK